MRKLVFAGLGSLVFASSTFCLAASVSANKISEGIAIRQGSRITPYNLVSDDWDWRLETGEQGRSQVLGHALPANPRSLIPRITVPFTAVSSQKGGPNTGVFLQITCDDAIELPVPQQKYSFGVVKAAQARGDFQVLVDRDRRALRVHHE